VLDVFDDDEQLAVIVEWVSGRPWSELAVATDSDAESVTVAYELARAVQAAHEFGVTHGRIRPASVIISDTSEVRLRGLGVDAALHGVAPGSDARAADLHAIGATLFLGLTGTWPDPQPNAPTIDGCPVVGPVGHRLPSPSEVRAGVPKSLSELSSACLLADYRPPTRKRIPDVDHAVTALARAVERATGSYPTDEQVPQNNRTDRAIRLVASIVIIGITLAGAVLLAGSLMSDESAEPVEAAAEPTPSAEATESTGIGVAPLPIANLRDFDPQGGDGTENPELVPLAVDGDLATAWETVRYKSATMDPKQGTGLLLDLGLTRPMSAVELAMMGTGTDIEIRIAEEPGENHTDYELLAGAVAAGEDITLRTPIPVPTRYVLVWMTNLPFQNGTYMGGIREVKVLG